MVSAVLIHQMKFIQSTPALLQSFHKWLANDPSHCVFTYSNCLPQPLQDQMEEDGFDMPDLSNQTTKTFQIQSLREVRTATAAAFKVLCKEGECLRKLFPN